MRPRPIDLAEPLQALADRVVRVVRRRIDLEERLEGRARPLRLARVEVRPPERLEDRALARLQAVGPLEHDRRLREMAPVEQRVAALEQVVGGSRGRRRTRGRRASRWLHARRWSHGTAERASTGRRRSAAAPSAWPQSPAESGRPVPRESRSFATKPNRLADCGAEVTLAGGRRRAVARPAGSVRRSPGTRAAASAPRRRARPSGCSDRSAWLELPGFDVARTSAGGASRARAGDTGRSSPAIVPLASNYRDSMSPGTLDLAGRRRGRARRPDPSPRDRRTGRPAGAAASRSAPGCGRAWRSAGRRSP